MTYIIIVIVVLASLGSIFWVLPSSYERKRMKFRQAAIAQGMSVQFVKPEIPPGLVNKVASQEYCIGYRLTFHDSGQTSLPAVRFFRSEDNAERWWQAARGDQCVVEDQSMQVLLNAFPVDVRAVKAGGPCVIAIWKERGDEADVALIKMQLEKLADDLLA